MGRVIELVGSRVYADSNVFIYALESLAEHVEVAQELLTLAADERLDLITSVLTLSECLVKPFKIGNPENVRLYKKAIRNGEGISAIGVSRKVIIECARIRAIHQSCRTPDAIHLATASLNQCDAFVTNDLRLKNIDAGIRIVLLSDLTI